MNSLRSLLVEGRVGEARTLAAQMLEKVPDEPSAALALARLALAEDDFQQARRWLEVCEARCV
ncbi:MAG TPA: tetratricopeptide repeat protein, partial [Myxococcaceae bacterium]|nr:tetratricopeptide repeat protein [Myxococcaceae bacterium]